LSRSDEMGCRTSELLGVAALVDPAGTHRQALPDIDSYGWVCVRAGCRTPKSLDSFDSNEAGVSACCSRIGTWSRIGSLAHKSAGVRQSFDSSLVHGRWRRGRFATIDSLLGKPAQEREGRHAPTLPTAALPRQVQGYFSPVSEPPDPTFRWKHIEIWEIIANLGFVAFAIRDRTMPI
jgi:hypothetical protein